VESKIARHLEVISQNCIDSIAQEELIAKLKNSFKKGEPLRLKIGFDPTASDIHLGHTVLLRKLRKLQDLGHFVHFIIGDFTAKIGDPSGRTALRPVLTDKEIKKNASTYTSQAFKILDKKKTKIIYNSIWYNKMKVQNFLSIFSSYTVARMLERDDFSQRMKENRPLTMLEFAYPLIQGYDSVKCQADIEFGGTDQKFNLIVGRHLQEVCGQKAQCVVTMPLLVGLDGTNKMSKSLGNYIGITEKSKAMFGKIMSISDEVMWEYFRLLTDCDLDQMKKMHPKEAKLALAKEIVSTYHSPQAAQRECEEFERIFSKGKLPKDLPIYKVDKETVDIIEVLYSCKVVASKNEARRLLSQGSISLINSSDPSISTTVGEQQIQIPTEGLIFKVGKRRFFKLILK
jgi:tyrosyl-tRNA synthetase